MPQDLKGLTIEEIQAQLKQVKDQIAQTGFGGFVMNTLVAKEKNLQDALNKLLQKKGILGESEADSLFEQLKLDKKRLLEEKSKRNWLTPVIILAGAVLAILVTKKLMKK